MKFGKKSAAPAVSPHNAQTWFDREKKASEGIMAKDDLYYAIRSRNFGIYTMEEQNKLRAAKVCVVGQGCVGELAAAELARIGFGTIRIIDQDTLELSNLNRNAYGRYSQVGRYKTQNMLEFINDAVAGTVNVEVANEMVNTKNSLAIFQGVDVVVQAIDNMYARVIVHRAAMELGIPVITMSGGPPYRAFVSTVLSDGVDYETLMNLPTKGLDLDLPSEELNQLHHELRTKRAQYAMEHGADKEWAKLYISGERQTWSITPERAYLTSTLQVHEAVNLILGRRLMAVAPKIIQIDLLSPVNIAKVKSPPILARLKGRYWSFEAW